MNEIAGNSENAPGDAWCRLTPLAGVLLLRSRVALGVSDKTSQAADLIRQCELHRRTEETRVAHDRAHRRRAERAWRARAQSTGEDCWRWPASDAERLMGARGHHRADTGHTPRPER